MKKFLPLFFLFSCLPCIASDWTYSEVKDPMTDKITYELKKSSNQDANTSLYVSCTGGAITSELIAVNRQILNRYLDIRIGDFKSTNKWFVQNMQGGSGAYAPDELNLPMLMTKGGNLKIRFNTPDESVIVDFDLEGFATPLQKMINQCK